MKSEVLEGKITITRPSYGDDREKIRISIRDNSSVSEFLEIEMGYAEFALAVTGLSHVSMTFKARGLENVGKKRIREKRSIICPLSSCCSRDELRTWLEENGKEEGWEVLSYLGSQTSIKMTEEGTVLNYSVEKYISPEDVDNG